MSDQQSTGTEGILLRDQDLQISEVAGQILDAGFGRGESYFRPGTSAWSVATVDDLYARYNERPDTSSDKFMVKLERQLSNAPDDTILLAAELMTLQALPLEDLNHGTKRTRIGTVLGWMADPVTIPADVDEAFATGRWRGGQGAHMQLWQWVSDSVVLLRHWWSLTRAEREHARSDPWAWRDLVRTLDIMRSLQEALLCLAFPRHFLGIVSRDDKRRVTDAFSQVITPTGDADRDLLEITLELQHRTGDRVNYYASPLLEQWKPAKDRGTRRAWLVRPRRPQGGEPALVTRWREHGSVSLAATHFGKVEPGADRNAVSAAVDEGYRHTDYAQRLQLTTEYHVFLSRMEPGDLVVTLVGGQAWIGEVTGEAEYADEDDDGRLRRSVVWSDQSHAIDTLPSPLPAELDQQGIVIDLTRGLDALEGLLAEEIEAEEPASVPPPQVEPEVPVLPKATAELETRLHINREWLQETLNLLQDRHQLIFYGPPGTGKTYLARALGRYITDTDAVRLVQFHPSYTYEDFFEGYRPTEVSDVGVGFRLQPGPLRQLAAEARETPGRPYVLIVDEINRANLAKVFGELYYLLEYRQDSVRLQYSPGESFTLPPNVFVIGTMNTADRSIALVDTAIRRRFAFIELHPDEPPIRDLLRDWLTANHKDLERARLLEALNEAIGAEDRDFKIGPSYLMKGDAERDGGLARVWQYSILPLLEEHYYGRMSRQQVRATFDLDAIRSRVVSSAEGPDLAADEEAEA